LLTEIHRQLYFSGIAVGIAGSPTVPAVRAPTPADILARSDLFGVIEKSQRELLAAHFETISLRAGETLIKEGANPEALYVLAAGVAEITIAQPTGKPRAVHRLHPGESLGAIGLITGSPYGATATALTPVKAYRLDKNAIAEAIKAEPALAKGLESLAQRGQAALRRDSGAHEEDKQGQSEMFLSRLRNLIHVLQSRA
jgi:CRP-like cAMP-binding protein